MMSPNELDLNLLTVLNALLQERHVTRAAEAVGLSEPTMSRAFRRLRRLFGDQLLVRVGREYYLTILGEELVEPVSDILRMIAQTVQMRPIFEPATTERLFTIAAAEYGAFLIIRPLVQLLAAQAPGVSIRVAPLTKTTLRDLKEGQLDFALAQRPPDSDLPGEDLFDDNWLCAIWAEHPEIDESLSLDQFVALPHVSYSLDPGSTHEVDPALAETYSVRKTVTIGSHFMLPLYLKGTRLVAMVPERTGKQIAELADIRLLKPPFDVPRVQLGMSWHPRSASDPAHSWLRDQIRSIGEQLRIQADGPACQETDNTARAEVSRKPLLQVTIPALQRDLRPAPALHRSGTHRK